MFDPELFIAECQAALSTNDPQQVVLRLVRKAMTDIEGVKKALGVGEGALFQPLFRSPELTIANMCAAPGSTSPIHNHCMWGVIGVYQGQEDNNLYERNGDELNKVETRSLKAGESWAMPVNLIHAINNPKGHYNAALHIYGGDLVELPGRSLWNPESDVEEAYDIRQVLAYTEQLSQ